MESPSSQAPVLPSHLPTGSQPHTSRAGVLMSTGSITVNTFLALRAGTQGRCRVALMQYLTLPCLPSNDVTSVLGWKEGASGWRHTETSRLGIPKDLGGLKDRDTPEGLPVENLGGQKSPDTEQWSPKPGGALPQSSTPDDLLRQLEAEWELMAPSRQHGGLSSVCR